MTQNHKKNKKNNNTKYTIHIYKKNNNCIDLNKNNKNNKNMNNYIYKKLIIFYALSLKTNIILI